MPVFCQSAVLRWFVALNLVGYVYAGGMAFVLGQIVLVLGQKVVR